MKLNRKLVVCGGAMLAFGLASCKKETPPPPPPKKEEPKRETPPPPPPKKEEPKKEPPKWTKDLPARPVTAKVMDMVWATIPSPGSEMASFGLYKVDAVTGNTATLADSIGTKYPDVPAAVIHPAGDASKLKAGDAAFGYAWAASKSTGVVTKVEAGKVTLKYAWAGKPTEKMMDHAIPLGSGVAPIAWIGYESGSFGTYKGLCVALEGEKVWVHTDSGHVEVVDKAKTRPLAILKDYKDGATVQAYSWGFGYRAGTIQKAVEKGLLYSVKIAGKEEVKDYFYFDLVEKL